MLFLLVMYGVLMRVVTTIKYVYTYFSAAGWCPLKKEYETPFQTVAQLA